MKPNKPEPPCEVARQPRRVMMYRGKPHRVPTLAEIAAYCRQMAWELDADAETVH